MDSKRSTSCRVQQELHLHRILGKLNVFTLDAIQQPCVQQRGDIAMHRRHITFDAVAASSFFAW